MTKRKPKRKQTKRSERQRKDVAVDPGNKDRFDQLLDDAIFGVKKKTPRG